MRRIRIIGWCCLLVSSVELSSCVGIGQMKGLSLRPTENVGAAPHGRGNIAMWGHQSIHTAIPPLTVTVSPAPQAFMVALGPLLPIVPWPPGIYHILKSKHDYEIPKETLQVHIEFLHAHLDGDSRYMFTPQTVRLNFSGVAIAPNKITCAARDASNLCQMSQDKSYSIVVSTISSSLPEMIINFDINASNIDHAVLDINSVLYDSEAIQMPKITIYRDRWWHTWP